MVFALRKSGDDSSSMQHPCHENITYHEEPQSAKMNAGQKSLVFDTHQTNNSFIQDLPMVRTSQVRNM